MLFSQCSQKHEDFSDYGQKDELSLNWREPEMTWAPTKIEAFLFEPIAGSFLSKHVDGAMSPKKW